MKTYFVYILTNWNNRVIYTGITNNLKRRHFEHLTNSNYDNFTNKYKVIKLIYFEEYPKVTEAIKREKQLKNWHRNWKLNLVKAKNPEFIDLFT